MTASLSLLCLLLLCKYAIDVSAYRLTASSRGARGVVGVLTELTNFFGGAATNGPLPARQRRYKDSVPQAVLYESLRSDFRNSYLFTGNIDPEIYDEECVFTDPTLSFTGLRAFETNLGNLQPYITRLIGANVVTLYSLRRMGRGQIQARWRMECCFSLPWRAVLDLCGETTYTFDGQAGGRIVDYSELWVAPNAASVLLQLLRSSPDKFLAIEKKLVLAGSPSAVDSGFRSMSVDVMAKRAFCGGRQRPCGSALLATISEYSEY